MNPIINNFFKGVDNFLHSASSSETLKDLFTSAATLQDNMDKTGRSVQGKLDSFSSSLRAQLGIRSEFGAWLNENEGDAWYGQLSIYLSKLPLKVMYNTISLMRCIIESVCHTAVHPVKGFNNLANALLRLAEDLTKPKTYALFGTSMMGASFAQAFVLSNPMLLTGVAAGYLLLFGGLLGAGVQVMNLSPEEKETKLFKLLAQLPEALIGGFLFGALIGKVQQISHAHFHPTFHKVSRPHFHYSWAHVQPSHTHILMPRHTMHPLARPYPLRPSMILPMPRPFPGMSAAPHLGSFTSVANSAGLGAYGTIEGLEKRQRADFERI